MLSFLTGPAESSQVRVRAFPLLFSASTSGLGAHRHPPPPNNSFKPTPCRGIGHVLYATLAHVRRPDTGRLNSGVRQQKLIFLSWGHMNHSLLISMTMFLAVPAFAQSQPIVLTPGELVDAYRANPIAAKRRFTGKTIQITGIVNEIQEGKAGVAYVYFGFGPWDGYVVEIATTEDTAAELKAGQKTTFECRSVRAGKRFDRDVLLDSCRISN